MKLYQHIGAKCPKCGSVVMTDGYWILCKNRENCSYGIAKPIKLKQHELNRKD